MLVCMCVSVTIDLEVICSRVRVRARARVRVRVGVRVRVRSMAPRCHRRARLSTLAMYYMTGGLRACHVRDGPIDHGGAAHGGAAHIDRHAAGRVLTPTYISDPNPDPDPNPNSNPNASLLKAPGVAHGGTSLVIIDRGVDMVPENPDPNPAANGTVSPVTLS